MMTERIARVVFLAVATIFALSAVALAQLTPERPVSAPQYGPAASDQLTPVIATDGSDFLVAWIDGRGSSAAIYANRVTHDGRVLDGTGIRVPLDSSGINGRLLGAYFIDGTYMLVYSYESSDSESYRVAAAIISTDGQLVQSPKTVFDGGYALVSAANATRVVVLSSDEAVAINGRGELIGRFPLPTQPSFGLGIASNGTTFLAATFSYDGTSNAVNLIALDSSGRPAEVTRIATSASGERALIASDGADYVVVYNDPRSSKPVAKSVSARAEVLSTAEALDYQALVWTGQSYLATMTLTPEQQIAALEVDRTGRQIKPVRLLGAGTPGIENRTAAAWNGEQSLLAWMSGSQEAPDGYEIVGVLSNADATALSPLITIPSSSNPQVTPVLASFGSQDLAVWAEPGGIYAARITSVGVPLDGRGFAVTAEATSPSRSLTLVGYATLRATYDGSAYVVAWGGSAGIKAQRIDATGSLLGSPIDVAPCSRSFDLAVDDVSAVVFSAQCSDGRLVAQRFGTGGPIGAAAPISPADMDTDLPRAAWNGTEWLVAWMQRIPLPVLISPQLYRGNVYAARMSSGLAVIDANSIPIAVSDFSETTPLVASDGRDFAVVWSHETFDAAAGLNLRRVQNDGAVGPPSLIASGPVEPASLVWTGTQYALAFTTAMSSWNRDIFLTHFSPHDSDPLPGDRVPVSVTVDDERFAAIAAPAGRALRILYTRVAPEPKYGGVSRVFTRDELGKRRRSVGRD